MNPEKLQRLAAYKYLKKFGDGGFLGLFKNKYSIDFLPPNVYILKKCKHYTVESPEGYDYTEYDYIEIDRVEL